jgi:hypothetical protein
VDNRRPEFTKRKKELARIEKHKQKLERKAQRDREKGNRDPNAPEEEDPDIAGIVPGPQAPPGEE